MLFCACLIYQVCILMVKISLHRFAQRSMDHRGTPTFPGIVATLIKDNEDVYGLIKSHLEGLVADMPNDEITVPSVSECIGVIYHVPKTDAVKVIKELDYREKGGYGRSIIKVQLIEDTALHKAGMVVDALVYTGDVDNPNFYNPHPLQQYELDSGDNIDTKDIHILENQASMHLYPLLLQYRDVIADIISIAAGPSGRNTEYLCYLTNYIAMKNRENGTHQYDKYLIALETKVRMRMGVWRGMTQLSPIMDSGNDRICDPVANSASSLDFLTSKYLLEPQFPSLPTPDHSSGVSANCMSVIGWGSNEANQLLCNCSLNIPSQIEKVERALPLNIISHLLASLNTPQ